MVSTVPVPPSQMVCPPLLLRFVTVPEPPVSTVCQPPLLRFVTVPEPLTY